MDGYVSDECRECGMASCLCPSDLDAPIFCAHNKDVDTYCPECAVVGEMALGGALRSMLDRLQRERDETKGAALAARFDRR